MICTLSVDAFGGRHFLIIRYFDIKYNIKYSHQLCTWLCWDFLCWLLLCLANRSNRQAARTVCTVNSGYGLNQWETTLQCNIVSRWLSPYSEWALVWIFWGCVVRDKPLDGDYILRYMRHEPSAVKISLALRTPIWHHSSLGSGDLHYTHWSYMLEKMSYSLYLKEHRQHDEICPDILYQLVKENCFIAIENLRTYT